jgi:prepilin-type N-terminal cleavage/methylation domain-containing protein
MRQRRAFSLVELLVVIGIIGLLVALLLPAVQAARESARATQCQSHLSQLGLALHQYHDKFTMLPPGWQADQPLGVPGWGWTAQMLPFIEQKNLFDRIQPHLAIGDSANQEARETVIPLLLCPSDPAPKLFVLGGGTGTDADVESPDAPPQPHEPIPKTRPKGPPIIGRGEEDEEDDWGDEPDDPPADGGVPLFRIARSNYVGVFGSALVEKQPEGGDGMFIFGRGIRFAQVADGLSNTIMVGERGARRGGSLWQGVVNKANKPIARVVGVADHPPNRNHHFDDFSSYHRSGVHFLYGDGGVRHCSNTIRFSIYKASGTIGGGEVARRP